MTTQAYEVENTGSTKTFRYDANGNLTSDGTLAFEWDRKPADCGRNDTNRSEFTYDGFDRRVRIVEKENGVTARDAQFIWIGTRIAEERRRTGEIARFSKTPRSMMVPTAT